MWSRRVRGLVAVAFVGAMAFGVVTSVGSATPTVKKSKFTIGYVQWAAAAGQALFAKDMKADAPKYGYTVKVANALGSAANANSLMRSFAAQHVNAIAVDSYSAANVAAGINAAVAAKIPVYIFYSPDPKAQKGVAVSLNVNAGRESAQAIIKNQGTKGSVLEFTLPSGGNCVLSGQRFSQVFSKYPGWKVQTQAVPAPGWAEVAAKTTRAWLLNHPTGKEELAIWGCWDDPAVGAASALASANPTRWDVKVYGQNTMAASARLLEANHYGASYYFPIDKVVAHLVDLIHERADTPYAQIKPIAASMPPVEITPKNVRAMIKTYPEILTGG